MARLPSLLLATAVLVAPPTVARAQDSAAPQADGAVAAAEPSAGLEPNDVQRAFEQHRRRWHDAELLRTVYEARQWRPIFVSASALTEEGEILGARVADFDAHGIDPDWLGLDRVIREYDHFRQSFGEPGHIDEAAALEVAIADTVVRYAYEMRYGNPANAPAGTADAADWARTELTTLLSATGVEFDRALYLIPPTLPAYVDLVAALARYREIQADGGLGTVAGPVETTATGDAVVALRRRLAIEGYVDDTTTESWTPDLAEAVRRFQAAHHIEPEDRVGDSTVEALNVPVEERIASLIVSLDRMRDTARGTDGIGDAVWVNVAGFYTQVWEDNELLFHTRSVVGRTAGGGVNQTPLFSDTMERLELNPVWYIPPRLARNMSPNPDRGIVRQDGRLVQLPGPDNALGRVKFLFPNTHSVYLHDTNHRDLFASTVRAYSSGCVRIDRPLELAALLIARDQQRDLDEAAAWVDEVMLRGETEIVPLATQLPVHLEYYTAHVAEDGITEFYGDIYNRDRRLVREIARRRDVAWDVEAAAETADDDVDGG